MTDLRVTGEPVERVEEALTAEALVVVGNSQRRFGSQRNELLPLRAEHRDRVARTGTFNLLPERVRRSDWSVAPAQQTSPTDGWRSTAPRR
jgi:malate synthase